MGAGKSDRPRSSARAATPASRACPEHAIDWSYQIDLDRCKRPSRSASSPAAPSARSTSTRKDDRAHASASTSCSTCSATPQLRDAPAAAGLLRARRRRRRAGAGGRRARDAVGEFEKPKYLRLQGVDLRAQPLAASRAATQCIDVCSTRAIRADGDHVAVEPHLCMGCGACATVCPSGAMSYAYPSVPDLGARVRTLLATYAQGRRPRRLPPAPRGGRARRDRAALARRGRGLPARVIPLEVHHVASVGLDVWLAALAYGASQVAVLATGAEAPQYRDALRGQMAIADIDRASARLPGRAFPRRRRRRRRRRSTRRCGTGRRRSRRASPRRSPPPPTSARRSALAIEHLRCTRRRRRREIALPAGAPFGAIDVNRDACTMCLACVGACPGGALARQRRRRRSFASSRRTACSAGSARRPARRTRSRSRRGSSSTPEAQGAARAQRGGDLQLHRAAASRSAREKMIDAHARASSPGIRCSRSRARSTGCRCAPTAASSTS